MQLAKKFILIIVSAGISISIDKLKRINEFISRFCDHISFNLSVIDDPFLILIFYFELFLYLFFVLFFSLNHVRNIDTPNENDLYM